MSRNDDNKNDTKGVSLARAPALVLGTVLLIAGLYFVYRIHTFPKLSQFPSGKATVDGKAFLGIFGVNGWSGELTAVAGGLLLFGAAQHLLAKTMSLIVGVVFAVVAVIALVHHHSALGLFAANIWTIILWGGSAVYLLINTLLPRAVRRETSAEPQREQRVRAAVEQPAQAPVVVPAAPVGAATRREVVAPAAQTDTSTIIPERGAIRVRPSDGSSVESEAGPS
jgi:hypothetical protein